VSYKDLNFDILTVYYIKNTHSPVQFSQPV